MIATAPHFGPPPPDRGAEIHRPLTGGLADGLPDPAVRPVRVALVDDEAGIHQLLSGIFRKHASQWILASSAEFMGRGIGFRQAS